MICIFCMLYVLLCPQALCDLVGSCAILLPSRSLNTLTSCTSADGQPQIGPTGKPMVKCEICGKELADRVKLYRHRKMHNGEWPHSCPYCDYKFNMRYIMEMHIKAHEKKMQQQALKEAQAKEAENQAGPLSMHAEPAPETPPPELERSQ